MVREERAARITAPGAAISGFALPRRVGPALLKGTNCAVAALASYAATAIVFWPLQMVPVVVV